MSDRFKFRGRTSTGETIYGWFVKCGSTHYIYTKVGNGVAPIIIIAGSEEQCTGLRDETRTKEYPKGKLIYEGDILHYEHSEYPHLNDNLVVYWQCDAAQMRLKGITRSYWHPTFESMAIHAGNIKIIGNTTENPELMES